MGGWGEKLKGPDGFKTAKEWRNFARGGTIDFDSGREVVG